MTKTVIIDETKKAIFKEMLKQYEDMIAIKCKEMFKRP